MKLKIGIYFFFVTALILGGCKKGWLDVNNNPNSPTTTTSDLVFTNAVNVNTSILLPHRLGSLWSGQWGYSTSFIGGSAELTYVLTNSDGFVNNTWINYYDNLADFEYVITNAAKDGRPHLGGFAKIMKALTIQRLVDLYGNIPYTEAFKGTEVLQPKYDDAKTIYEDLIKQLDAAIAEIKAATANSERSDIVFGGNRQKWIRFANTLKMRILMRQSTMSGRDGYITTEINKIVSEGSGLLTQGEDVTASPNYVTGVVGKINPFYNTYGYDANGALAGINKLVRINSVLINQLKNSNDTFRLKRIASPRGDRSDPANVAAGNHLKASSYSGVPLGGQGNSYLEALTSPIGPVYIPLNFSATSGVSADPSGQIFRMVIMTSAEAHFLMAEAKQRFPSITLALSAEEYYKRGVTESFRITGTDVSKATVLLNSGINNSDFAASSDKLAAIFTQKWIALANYDGLEAWAEQRKSNVPSLPISQQAATASQPVRFPYPLVEESANTPNVPKGINILTSKLFWDN